MALSPFKSIIMDQPQQQQRYNNNAISYTLFVWCWLHRERIWRQYQICAELFVFSSLFRDANESFLIRLLKLNPSMQCVRQKGLSVHRCIFGRSELHHRCCCLAPSPHPSVCVFIYRIVRLSRNCSIDSVTFRIMFCFFSIKIHRRLCCYFSLSHRWLPLFPPCVVVSLFMQK